MSGLLGGVLPWVYSQGDTAKRKLRGLLDDPLGTLQQTVGHANDRAGGLLDLTRQAGAEPGFGPATRKLGGLLGDAYSPVGMVVGPSGTIAAKVTNLKGEKVPAPTTFYRGETPGADRVLTKDANWDAALFAADNPYAARLYGANVTEIRAKPGANIVYEGTKEFNSLMKGYGNKGSMLDWSSEASRRAREAGFDAVWFKRQSDLGTAILDRSKFDINGNLINNTGGLR